MGQHAMSTMLFLYTSTYIHSSTIPRQIIDEAPLQHRSPFPSRCGRRSQYLFVRLAPHPPSWYIRQQRAWIAPFAFGGAAAAQQVMTAPVEGYRDHRWAAATTAGFGHGIRIQISIILISFCPVLIYYLVLAFQRATAGREECTPDAAAAAAVAGTTAIGDETVARNLSRPFWGWWAVHWHAVFKEDSIQVAISSWSAAASGNAFHSPGTARVRRHKKSKALLILSARGCRDLPKVSNLHRCPAGFGKLYVCSLHDCAVCTPTFPHRRESCSISRETPRCTAVVFVWQSRPI